MKRIYVGIDWADDHHDIHVTDDTAEVLDSFTIPYNYEGMEKLRERLAKFSSSPENVLVAIESNEGLLFWNLLEEKYQVYLINPKAMSRYRDRYRISSSKSDPEDAMVLANILRTDLHLYKPFSKDSWADARLKHLTRAHKSLIQEKVKLVNQLTTQLKNYYPVVLQIFSHLDQEITLAFLQQYPSPEKAKTASLEELQDFFRKEKYSHPDKVLFIHKSLHRPSLKAPRELAEIYEMIVLSLVPVLHCLLGQIKGLEKRIALVFEENPAHDMFSSLPAGPIIAARLNAEVGSASARYPTRESLQTEAGTAPVTKRSGKSIIVCFRWQCNKHLRNAVQSLARESVHKCPWARRYFANQLRLGHKASRAYRALGNRWTAIIWKMLQEGQCFSQARLEDSLTKALHSSIGINKVLATLQKSGSRELDKGSPSPSW